MNDKKATPPKPQNDCDPYGYCMHKDTAKNRLLEGLVQIGVIHQVVGCPLCERAKNFSELD